MHGDLRLLLQLGAALGAAQIGFWILARLLGRPLRCEAIAAGLLLPLLVLAPWMFGNVLLAPTQALAGQIAGTEAPAALEPHARELNDAVFQFLPWELEVRRAFSKGRLPFWSDLVDGGSSPWANPQAAVLSPIAMAARVLPIQHYLLGALAIKMLAALQGAWIVARSLGTRRSVALVVGIAFALSGAIIAWALFAHSAAAAWSPWCVAAGLALTRTRNRTGRVFGLQPGRAIVLGGALSFAGLLLSGQPEVAAATGLLTLLVSAAFARRGRRAAALRRTCTAVALGAGLAAPIVMPFLAVVGDSQRAHEHLRREDLAARAGPPHSGSWFAGRKGLMLLAPANPLAYGKPFHEPFRGPVAWTIAETAYAGLASFLGCLLAIASRRRSWAWPFLGFAAVALLLAADFRPLTRWWFMVPPLRLPEYARFVPVGALALTVAGGLGLEALLRSRRRRLLLVAPVVALSSLLVAPRAEAALPWLLLLAAAAIAMRWRAAAWLFVLGALLDQTSWARWMLPRGDPALFYPRTPEVETLIREAGPAYRAVGEDMLVYPSILPFYGIGEARPHDPLVPDDYVGVLRSAFGFSPSTVEYFSPMRRIDHPLRRFLGIRAIVSNLYLPEPAGAVALPHVPGHATRLFLDDKALPRAFAARGVDIISREQIDAWIAGMVDPGRVAVFEEELGDWPLPPRLQEPAVELARLDRGRIELRVPPPGAKLVATSIPGPRGWRAWSDERPLRTLTVDGAFLGVLVPGRIERVELAYRPPGLLAGLAAFGVAVLGLLVVAAAPASWAAPSTVWRIGLAAALALASIGLAAAVKDRLDRLGAPPTAHPRAPHRWAWGTPPPEGIRDLVEAARPFLGTEPCQVGFTGSWPAEEALFPPLWAAYFLPECDVIPLPTASAAGPELRIVAGGREESAAIETIAPLPGGALYKLR